MTVGELRNALNAFDPSIKVCITDPPDDDNLCTAYGVTIEVTYIQHDDNEVVERFVEIGRAQEID